MNKKTLTRTWRAAFTLKNKDGHTVLRGYSEHVWIKSDEDADEDMLHFSADSMSKPIGEICQIVADLGGTFEYDGWLDAYVPMSCVWSITFEPK